MKSDIVARLAELLAYDSHSRRYQAIPAFVRKELGPVAEGYASAQLAWDAPRFDWIDRALPETLGSSVELGSSLGYFSLRLAAERGFSVEGFEPVAAYAEASNLFASLTGLQDLARFHPRGVGIDDIATLAERDCLITLNVLHHAGNVYDREAVAERGGWHAYARDWLGRASTRFAHMIFQTGNSVRGEAHFPSETAIDTLVPLLEESGWNVCSIGLVTDFEAPAYDSFERENMARIPRIGCRRNPDSGLVEYRRDDELLTELAYGTLQRPIFYCMRA